MIISLDCETTGVDLAHGARPFLVTTCSEDGTIRFWEWDVDPLTRRPEIPGDDLQDITELLDAADLVYLHNSKFDARALATVGVQLPWDKVRDTLVGAHLLASNHRHDLTACCSEYLGVDIEPYEEEVKKVTRACRTIAKRDYPHWKLAREGGEGMPSVVDSSKRDEDKPWKNDMWLPRALLKAKHTEMRPLFGDSTWENTCSKYANADSEHTLFLGLEMERRIRQERLWKIYEHRLRLMWADFEMETYGVTARGAHTISMADRYGEHVAEAEAELVDIAAEYGHKLELAKGAALNDNMRDFFYGSIQLRCPTCGYAERVKHWNGDRPESGSMCPKCIKSTKRRASVRSPLEVVRRNNLALPVIISNKTKNATLDGDAMREYVQTLDDGPALDFVEILADKRMYDTALTYIQAYRRYWVPVEGHHGYYRIHASINPCGTDHLRQASNSPNMQNVSGDTKELSNRECFGPLPGREWWRMDYKSIENRLPVYECREPKMVEVFEQPDTAPYWGSLYYLTASVLYPDEFWPLSEEKERFKREQPRLYKQAKFFVLARQYGCGPAKGDLLSRVHKSFNLVANEFPLMAALQRKYLDFACKWGYVETLPDRSVDPERGYPILASRTDDGRVLSTTPFNYHVSGTACWCKNVALVRCAEQCAEWRADGFDAHVALEVHDELLFDFPRGETLEENLPRALVLKGLMEQSGEDLIPSIPTPVSLEYCAESWADGVSISAEMAHT